jgi:hypothetical protein
MAFLGQEFRTEELPPVGNTGDFEPIPEGWYAVTITQAEVKATKAGTGSYIGLRLDVTGPTYQGRVLWCNLNISNPNPKAEEIGRQQLNQIMLALGLPAVRDTDQILNGRVMAKVAIKEGKNVVKAFKAVDGSALPSAPSQAATKPASASPPWATKK